MRAAIRIFIATLALAPAIIGAGVDGGGPVTRAAPAARERRFTIIYTAEIHGAVEPCGCTSDPLGDISRFAEIVRAARKQSGAVLLVDAGGILYAEGGLPARARAADNLRAAFLATELEKLGLAGAGLAETDLSGGPALVRPRRLASNLSATGPVEPPSVKTVGGVKIGLLGIADPALADLAGVKAGDADSADPIRAARRDAEKLRREGAEVVVLLAPVDKALARRAAREAAVDFVVAGRQVGQGMRRADTIDRGGAQAFVVAPADELQRVGRIDVVLRDDAAGRGATGDRATAGLRDAGGAEAIALRQAEIDAALARLDDELGRWSKNAAAPDGEGDPAFVAAKRRERDALAAERAKLAAAPYHPPAEGSYFTNQLVTLHRSLPRDPALAAGMKRLDARIAAVNLAAATPPPPPEPGRASYVGIAKCGGCHKPAVAFWKKTVHAQAWKTLVDGGKQADYKCVSCHVTGYGQVGGSTLGFTKGLQDVQCENCHGPGSIHVAEKGLEEPAAVRRGTPESTCSACHNEHHSDTFQYQAYLRDILGPGHGAAARAKLGNGPTGHSLRTAALAKAKVEGAKQLRKM